MEDFNPIETISPEELLAEYDGVEDGVAQNEVEG